LRDAAQRVEKQPRTGGLPVRPGDGQRAAIGSEQSEKLGVLQHRDPATRRFDDLRIVETDRGGAHDHLGFEGECSRVTLPDRDRHAACAKCLDETRIGAILAAEHVTALEEQECGAGHARATGAEQVHARRDGHA